MALFPAFSLKFLRRQHGQRWGRIVEDVSRMPMSDPYVMAFVYTVRRLRQEYGLDNACYDPRCAECAREVLSYYEGTEDELIAAFRENLQLIEARMEGRALLERRHDRLPGGYVLQPQAQTAAIA